MTDQGQDPRQSTWPHRLAVCLACATFPLIWIGGLVTTYDAGMAVPDWPTTYGYNMFLYPWRSWFFGPWDLFIEHGHRLLGALVGLLTISFNVAVWKCDARRWLRWLALGALLLVVCQGLLGGMRVRMASTQLARIHGCTGPLFFALCLGLCSMTSRFWHAPPRRPEQPGAEGRVWGWLLLLLAYLQVVVGAHLRHPGVQWSPGTFRTIVVFHLVTAVLLVCASSMVVLRTRSLPVAVRRPAVLVWFGVLAQLVLGVATWRVKYGWPTFLPWLNEGQLDGPAKIAIHTALAGGTVAAESMAQALTVTSHVALGSLILAGSAWYASRLGRYGWCGQAGQLPASPTSVATTRGTFPRVSVGGYVA